MSSTTKEKVELIIIIEIYNNIEKIIKEKGVGITKEEAKYGQDAKVELGGSFDPRS